VAVGAAFGIIPVVTVGFGTPVAFAVLVLVLRPLRRTWVVGLWISAVVYAAAVFGMIVNADAAAGSRGDTLFEVCLMIAVVGALQAVVMAPWVAVTAGRAEAERGRRETASERAGGRHAVRMLGPGRPGSPRVRQIRQELPVGPGDPRLVVSSPSERFGEDRGGVFGGPGDEAGGGVLRRAVRVVVATLGAFAWCLVFMTPVLLWLLVTERVWAAGRLGFLAAAAVSLAAAALGGVKARGMWKAAARLRDHGIPATATITKVTERYVHVPSGFSGWVSGVDVVFLDAHDGRVRADYTAYAKAGGRRAGDTVQIVYDPRKPTSISPLGHSARPDDDRSFSAIMLVPGVLVLLGICIYFAYRAVG
jgi:hypothetical protein